MAIGQETKKIWMHLIGNGIAIAILFAVAIALGFVENWCKEKHLPDHLCSGIRIVSGILFVIDAVAVCGFATIIMVRLLWHAWTSKFK